MAYENLKQEIQDNIKTNGEGAITGQILQDTLLDMVDVIGQGYVLYSESILDDSDPLPPVPTDGKKYYLFAYNEGAERDMGLAVYFSNPDIDSGEWRKMYNLITAKMWPGGEEGETMPYLASVGYVREYVREYVSRTLEDMKPIVLEYTRYGVGNSWDEFVSDTHPTTQEAGDVSMLQYIAQTGSTGQATSPIIELRVTGQDDGRTFTMTGRKWGDTDWCIYFSEGHELAYDSVQDEYYLN